VLSVQKPDWRVFQTHVFGFLPSKVYSVPKKKKSIKFAL